MLNTRVIFAKRPLGEPDDDCFRIEQVEVPELGDGQILIKVCWLSLDPYMRGRMNDVKSYADHCMSEFRKDDRFVWQASKADDWRIAPADHITTRYETKGLGDCAPVFMDWVRV